jgi:serine/threonine protein kinase
MSHPNPDTSHAAAEDQRLRDQERFDSLWDFLTNWNQKLSPFNPKGGNEIHVAACGLSLLQESLKQANWEGRTKTSVIMDAWEAVFPDWFKCRLLELAGERNDERAEWREQFPYLYRSPNPEAAQIGPYRVLAFVGSGAMGAVFKAIDTRAGQPDHPVAIKVVDPREPIPNPKRRFKREANNMKRLVDPHIVQFREYLTQGDKAYLVMQYVYGPTLLELMNDHSPRGVPTPLIVDLIRQVAVGLKSIERIGGGTLIHRDLKPENLLLERADTNYSTPYGWWLRIADFGLATDVREQPITKENQRPGTFRYMAPEQLQSTARSRSPVTLTPRADIYALGVIAYEMLAGGRDQASDHDIRGRRALAGMDTPALQKLAPVVMRMLEPDPNDRPDAAEIVDEMTHVLELLNPAKPQRTQAVPSHPPEPEPAKVNELPPRTPSRRRFGWLVFAVLVVSATGGVISYRLPSLNTSPGPPKVGGRVTVTALAAGLEDVSGKQSTVVPLVRKGVTGTMLQIDESRELGRIRLDRPTGIEVWVDLNKVKITE